MATGRVLQFDQERGYGFVAADDGGEDVFLHASVFDGDGDVLAPGTRVEFKIMEGDRGRKAFAAHLIGESDSEGGGVRAPRPVQPAPPAPAPASQQAQTVPPSAPHGQAAGNVPDDEQLCDVLSPTELGQELTELLLGNVPTLTGQQILEVRQNVLDCAKKHGWIDI